MERNLKVERLYYLGEYKNIKFINELTGIPEEVTGNAKLVELLFMQEYIQCEIAYRNYVRMIEYMNEKYGVIRDGKRIVDPEVVMEFLQEQKSQNLKELLAEITNKEEKESE